MPLLRVVLLSVVLALVGVTVAVAQDNGPTPSPTPPPGCAECHIDVVAAWRTSTHAHAYSNATFQTAWQSQGQDVDCLACHTTGFVARTGEYAHEEITCEACHGATTATHPPDPVTITPGTEVCANCHPTTYTEWQRSAHGQPEFACTTCHQPHANALRFATPNELCLDCHSEDARDDYTHLTHPDENCVDCHWFHPKQEDLDLHVVSGDVMPTGHVGTVETVACVSCHEEITDSQVMQVQADALSAMNLTASDQPILEASLRINELEAEVDTVKARGSNTAALRLAQGLIIGLAAGGIVVVGLISFHQRSSRKTKDE